MLIAPLNIDIRAYFLNPLFFIIINNNYNIGNIFTKDDKEPETKTQSTGKQAKGNTINNNKHNQLFPNKIGLKHSSTNFNDINNQDDESVLKMSKKIELDIAIDLMCHTGDRNRFAIFLKKLAPIQINFLGYPGTSGSKAIDYIIADKIINSF